MLKNMLKPGVNLNQNGQAFCQVTKQVLWNQTSILAVASSFEANCFLLVDGIMMDLRGNCRQLNHLNLQCSPKDPWCWNIYLLIGIILQITLRVNVGKYSSTMDLLRECVRENGCLSSSSLLALKRLSPASFFFESSDTLMNTMFRHS